MQQPEAATKPLLFYEVHGTAGPFALLVHGFLSSRAQWLPNLPALSRYCRPVVVELFGHGRSPTPDVPRFYTPQRGEVLSFGGFPIVPGSAWVHLSHEFDSYHESGMSVVAPAREFLASRELTWNGLNGYHDATGRTAFCDPSLVETRVAEPTGKARVS